MCEDTRESLIERSEGLSLEYQRRFLEIQQKTRELDKERDELNSWYEKNEREIIYDTYIHTYGKQHADWIWEIVYSEPATEGE
jgi:hypothetical protein